MSADPAVPAEGVAEGEVSDGRYGDVSVVMITRNEEGAVGKVIRDALAALPGADVFVIDGSDDRTPELAREAGATVVQEPGGGFGPAFHAALLTPTRPIVVTVDADDTYPASVYPVLVALVRSGWDVAGTDRLGPRPPKTMPLPNWIANKIFSNVATARVGHRLKDVHSGQRAYRREVLHDFDWDYAGKAFPVDLVMWPAANGYSVIDIPIEYFERIGETTLDRWPSGKATVRRLSRPKAQIRRRSAD